MIKNINEIADQSKVPFARDSGKEFFNTLRKRVDEYFNSNHLTKKANAEWIIKAVLIFGLFWAAYFGIILGSPTFPVLIGLFVLFHMMEVQMVFNIGHDAAHEAVSKKPWVNEALTYVFNLGGSTEYLWKLKHNISHHYNTNVPGHDADIELMGFLRYSPGEPLKPIHRFQHLFAFCIYPLLAFFVVFGRDFKLMRLRKMGNLHNLKHSRLELFKFWATKIWHVVFEIAVPIALVPLPWWQVVIASSIGRLFAGATLAFVLAPAHLVEDSIFPEPGENGMLDYSFHEHQVVVTTDFNVDSKLSNVLYGGLNTHAIHHIFPNINHVHYIPITKILQQTCREFGLKYVEMTHLGCIKSHYRFLRKLGKEAWDEKMAADKENSQINGKEKSPKGVLSGAKSAAAVL